MPAIHRPHGPVLPTRRRPKISRRIACPLNRQPPPPPRSGSRHVLQGAGADSAAQMEADDWRILKGYPCSADPLQRGGLAGRMSGNSMIDASPRFPPCCHDCAIILQHDARWKGDRARWHQQVRGMEEGCCLKELRRCENVPTSGMPVPTERGAGYSSMITNRRLKNAH